MPRTACTISVRAPEFTVSWVWWLSLPLVAVAVQIGSAYWTFLHGSPLHAVAWQSQAMCFWRISILGLSPVLVVLWLVSKGFPLRPRIAGLSAGIGGGLLSEGIYRLHCGLSHPAHIVVWHTSAILVMGLLGVLAGIWWEKRRLQHWLDR